MTEPINFKRDEPGQSILPPLSDDQRVIDYLACQPHWTNDDAKSILSYWHLVQDARKKLGISDG